MGTTSSKTGDFVACKDIHESVRYTIDEICSATTGLHVLTRVVVASMRHFRTFTLQQPNPYSAINSA